MADPLFLPFRALGYITDETPFAVLRRGKETTVTVSVGKAWQTYSCNKLTLLLVGPQLEHKITALACKGDFTFAASKTDIIACQRMHRVGTYSGHAKPILQMMSLGDHLLSLGHDRRLLLWKLGSYDAPLVSMDLGEGFQPTCMAHPDTYLNKVVVGSADGRLQLWNFSTGTRLFEFSSFGGSAIKCIAPSPALDVVGLGLADGRCVLHNLRFDEQVASFANAAGAGLEADAGMAARDGRDGLAGGGSPCTSISFRTGPGPPLMAAGGLSGVITVWDLEKRRLATIIRDAHDGSVTKLHFFPGEPVLMSAAADNSIKHWIFDGADGAARLLRFRSGHASPPSVLRFYGDGLRILSAGQDRAFRMFSTIQDQQSRELSQGHSAHRAKRLKMSEQDVKLPPVLSMDACQVRERDWCNVITAHEGASAAYTWRLQHFTLGKHRLQAPRTPTDPLKASAGPLATGKGPGASQPLAPDPLWVVTAVALSCCGNFSLVGTAGGNLDRFNMQSGIHRGSYSRKASGKGSKVLPAHDGAIMGVAGDAWNRNLVSAGVDGVLRVWGFKTLQPSAAIEVGSPVSRITHQPFTGMLAAACDDFSLRLFDVKAARLVRHFTGHQDRVTDMVLSKDGRWLLSSSLDGTLHVWDIPAGRILQVLRMGEPITAVSLAPAMDMLATTHVGRRGIYLWSNQLLFGTGVPPAHSDRPVDARLPAITPGEDPSTLVAGSSEDDETTVLPVGASDSEDEDEDDDIGTTAGDAERRGSHAEAGPRSYEARRADGTPQPLTPELLTLSLLPRTQWHNLAHLDAIKARSRPVQPPKKPEAAPFFLPTVPGLEGRPVFDTQAARPGLGDDLAGTPASRASMADKNKGASDRFVRGAVDHASPFVRLLRQFAEDGSHEPVMQHLRKLTPAAVDGELRSMEVLEGAESEEEVDDVQILLKFVGSALVSRTNFEYLQAILHVALQIHGDLIMQHASLRQQARLLQQQLSSTWSNVEQMLQRTQCMAEFFGSLHGSAL